MTGFYFTDGGGIVCVFASGLADAILEETFTEKLGTGESAMRGIRRGNCS